MCVFVWSEIDKERKDREEGGKANIWAVLEHYLNTFDAAADEALEKGRIGLFELQACFGAPPHRLMVGGFLPGVADLGDAALLRHFEVAEDHREDLRIEATDMGGWSVVPYHR